MNTESSPQPRAIPPFMRPTPEKMGRDIARMSRIMPGENFLIRILDIAARRFSPFENRMWTGTVAGPCYIATGCRCQNPGCAAGSPQSFERGGDGAGPQPCTHRFPHTFQKMFDGVGEVTLARNRSGWDSLLVKCGGALSLRIEVADPAETPDYRKKLLECLEQQFAPTLDDEDEEEADAEEGREALERFHESSHALLACTFEVLADD